LDSQQDGNAGQDTRESSIAALAVATTRVLADAALAPNVLTFAAPFISCRSGIAAGNYYGAANRLIVNAGLKVHRLLYP
jgi:hypothetical protein